MWRKCDLHIHTWPNEQSQDGFDPNLLVESCLDHQLDVIAITNHDTLDQVGEIVAAAESRIIVIPGIEISTNHGHVLALGAGPGGLDALSDLVSRLGVGTVPQVPFDELTSTVRDHKRPSGEMFRNCVLLIGSHVDRKGALLGPGQPLSAEDQVRYATRLTALEVTSDQTISQWGGGIKGSETRLPLIRGSDSHASANWIDRYTWLYLPAVTHTDLLHAMATSDASVSYDVPPTGPDTYIESISFAGGLHDGQTFSFLPRTNAIIGPPSSGKSLIVDSLRFAFGLECDVEEIAEAARNRLDRALEQGSTITVRGQSADGPFTMERVWGGRLPGRTGAFTDCVQPERTDPAGNRQEASHESA